MNSKLKATLLLLLLGGILAEGTLVLQGLMVPHPGVQVHASSVAHDRRRLGDDDSLPVTPTADPADDGRTVLANLRDRSRFDDLLARARGLLSATPDEQRIQEISRFDDLVKRRLDLERVEGAAEEKTALPKDGAGTLVASNDQQNEDPCDATNGLAGGAGCGGATAPSANAPVGGGPGIDIEAEGGQRPTTGSTAADKPMASAADPVKAIEPPPPSLDPSRLEAQSPTI